MFEFLAKGLFGFIIWLNGFLKDFGLTVIVFSIILKLVLLPIEYYAFLEEAKIRRLKPKIDEILKKYKTNFQQQADELSKVYKEENYNPLFTLIIQILPIPIFIGTFIALNSVLKTYHNKIYFLEIIDLSQRSIFLALAVCLLQILSLYNLPKEQRKFALFLTGLIIVILFQFPALFALYWLANLVFTLLERKLFLIITRA